MVHISKNVSIFDFASFLLNFIFLFNKKYGVFDSKTFIIPSTIKIIRHSFATRPLIFKFQQEI